MKEVILKRLYAAASQLPQAEKLRQYMDVISLLRERRRQFALTLVALFLWATCAPTLVLANQVASKNTIPLRAVPKNGVKKGPRKVELVKPPTISVTDVSDAQLVNARVFLEPLAPLSVAPRNGENESLAKALLAYKERKTQSNVDDLKKFLVEFPDSRWKPSLELNMARTRFESGYYTEALGLWKDVWTATKSEQSPALKSVADEAVSQIMLLVGRLGETQQLESYLTQIEKRPMYGTVELRVKESKDGLMSQKQTPEKAYKCGPYAVNSLLNIGKATQPRNSLVDKLNSTSKGTNLADVKKLADGVGLHYQLAKRAAGAKLTVPSVVHYKLNHFAAIVGESNGLYHLQDPTFDEKGNSWFTADALNAELDGYSLVPDGSLPTGWEPLSQADAQHIWGKGDIPQVSAYKGPGDPVCFPCMFLNYLTFNVVPDFHGMLGWGMAVANVFSMNSTLKIQDMPVGYSASVGPDVGFFLNYNHQEGAQPGTYTFSNFGQDWTVNWISYLTLDGSNNATVRPRGGGYQVFNYTIPDNIQNPYPADLMTQAILTVVSAGVYQRKLPDGSIEVFNQPDGTGRIFMTQVIDPQGNSVYIQYDANFRLVSVTDAVGLVSKLTYLSNTVGNAGFYKISQITDPFSRSATFTYDSTQTYLLSSTDTIGITSQFQYDTSSSFINLLTTPYGSTSFTTYSYNDGLGQTVVVLKINYPDGTSAVNRLMYGYYYDRSDFWDRESMMLYPLDYQTRGIPIYPMQTSVWQASVAYILQPVADSVTSALITSTSYTYPGEGKTPDNDHNTPGTINQPSTVTQGSEVSTFAYNTFGKVTHSVDPVGRTFSYQYDANNIDLLEARQTQGSNNDLLGKWFYNNTQHEPNKYIDGSGQTTNYTYNNFGEVLTITDANNNTTTNSYNGNGQLIQTDGPLPGNSDVTNFAYDGFNRLYSSTDSQGYSVFYNYDNADRPTLVSYPDGTTSQTIYNRHDPVLQKDRIGRWTQTAYDSMRQPLFQTDPLGRKTQYSWCGCGAISQLTDPNNNITSFQHNQAAQLTSKTISDGSSTNYAYDGYGNLTYRLDNLGQETDYAYNLDNTLATTSYHYPLTQAPVNYTWDPNYSRLTSVQNGWGTYTYAYNPYITDPFGTPTTGGGKLASVSNNVIANSTVTYQYDVLGRTINRQINGASNSVTWAYDAMSRVTSESNTLGSFAYHYVDDLSGASKGDTRLSSISYPNGQVTNFNYLSPLQDERLLGITNLDPTGKVRSQFNYGYDSAGQIKRWGQQNAGYTPAQYALNYDQAGQLTAAQSSLNGSVMGGSQYSYNYDPGSNKTSTQSTTIQTAQIGGTVTAGDVLTITVQDSGLTGGSEVVSYTVLTGNTLATISSNLAAAITADTNLQAVGVNAVASGNVIKLKSASPNVTTFTESTNGGATETVTPGVSANTVQNAAINLTGSGYTTRANDVLSLTVYNSALSGGARAISYTIPSNGASLSSIASGLSTAISSDSILSSIGVSSTAASNVLSLSSSSSNLTTYGAAATPIATTGSETVAFSANISGNMTATVGGTSTTGDTVRFSFRSSKLANGQETIGYLVPTSATLSTTASGISTAINADTNLQAIGLTSTASAAVVTITSTPTYTGSKSTGATETITLGSILNGNVAATIAGTITAGNTVTIQTSGGGLAAPVSSTYTVLLADTTSTIATGLAALINSNTSLQAIGVTAQASANVVNVKYNPTNYPSATAASVGGATELISLAMNSNVNQQALIGGTKTTGDVLTIGVNDFGLSGGASSVSYTVASGDTLATITSGLAAAVNASTSLQAIGVSATAASSVLTLKSNSQNVTSYTHGTSSGATETLVVGLNPNGTETLAIGGTKTTGNVLTLVVNDAGLTTGQESVAYTVVGADTLPTIASGIAAAINADTNLQGIGVTATAVSTVVNVKSASVNATTYAQLRSSGSTETLTLQPSMSVIGDSFNSLNELVARSATGAITFQGNTNKPVKSGTVNSSVVSLNGYQNTGIVNYSGTATPASAGIQLNFPTVLSTGETASINGATTANVQAYGGIANGYLFAITTYGDTLTGGQETVSYTTTASDTTSTIAANLASLFSADTKLQGLGLSATASTNIITVGKVNPTYSASTSVGATETVTVGPTVFGKGSVSIGGTATVGDTITIATLFPSLSGGQKSITYTVQTGDNLDTIAAGISTLVNANSNLQAIRLSSTSGASMSLLTAESFTANSPVASGKSSIAVSATDGGSNTKTNNYQSLISSTPTTQSLTFDLNGNMTSDGTNTYQWDAENRLVKIVYPGTQNYTQFTSDYLGRCVSVVEIVGGNVTNTSQLIWVGDALLESRNAGGSLFHQYFSFGQVDFTDGLTTDNFYDLNHRGDIVGVSNNAGVSLASFRYDFYGNPSVISGSFTPDFGFTGLYVHRRSGLNLAMLRAYSSVLQRWINRDPVGELGGVNLYDYCHNNPVNTKDPTGRFAIALPLAPILFSPIGAAVGGGIIVGGGLLIEVYNAGQRINQNLNILMNQNQGAGHEPNSPTGEAGGQAQCPVGRRGKGSGKKQGVGTTGRPQIQTQPGSNPPMTNDGTDYSGHSQDRMQERGLVPSVVNEALEGPGSAELGRNGNIIYTSNDGVTVITNPGGKVISAY